MTAEFQYGSEVSTFSYLDHTLHISELKYAATHSTFLSFLEIHKAAGAYSLQIYNYLSQIQRKTKAFLLIVRHNTEGQPFSAWQAVIACSFSLSD